MKLTQKALTKIDQPDTRLRLALGLSFSETWIRSLIAANKDNGPLTTAKAIQVIKQETGLTDSEILEEETEHETVNK